MPSLKSHSEILLMELDVQGAELDILRNGKDTKKKQNGF
jgi:hypothetical protein